MKKFTLTVTLLGLLIFSLAIPAEASSTMWSQTYGGSLDDTAAAIVQTADGGYAIAGTTHSFGAGSADFWLIKTDANGNMEWNQTYGGPASDVAVAMVQTGDGGYAVTGWTSSLKGFPGLSSYMFLIKVDVNGNIQWNSTYEGLGDNNDLFAVQTDDGGYALAGTTRSSYENAYYDIWFAKVDAEGESIPEFPSWAPLLIMSVVVLVVAVIYRRALSKPNERRMDRCRSDSGACGNLTNCILQKTRVR